GAGNGVGLYAVGTVADIGLNGTHSLAGYIAGYASPTFLGVGAQVNLAAAGLDAVLVESGITAGPTLVNDSGTQLTSINARQALALILAGPGLGGILAGATTANPTVTGTGAGTPQSKTRA